MTQFERSTLRHVQQAEDSMVCGQCCVAMLCDVPYCKAMTAVGHQAGTHYREVLDAVLILGRMTGKMYRGANAPRRSDADMLVRVRHNAHWKAATGQSINHWICRVEGVWHDPSSPWPSYINHEAYRITSAVEVL